MAFSIWKHGSFKNAVCNTDIDALFVTLFSLSFGYVFWAGHPLPLTPADVEKVADRAASPVVAYCIRKSVQTVPDSQAPLRKQNIHEISKLCEFAAELKQNPPVEETRTALMAECLFTKRYEDFIHGKPSSSWEKHKKYADTDPVVLYSVFGPMLKMPYCPRLVDAQLADSRPVESYKATAAAKTPAP